MVKVSIVIPAYNYARFLGEAIQSVLDQTFKDFEIIVIDDGSTDNTREVVSRFKDARIRYIYQDHIGVSVAENTGLNAARGEYITGLGADDLYLPQNLEIKVKLLDSRPKLGMVCSDAYIFDDRTGVTIGRVWRDDPSHHCVDPQKAALHPLESLIIYGCFIAPQASMMRRTVFDEVGGFDNSLFIGEDWDLFVRIVQRFPIEIIDMPLLKLRRHSNNLCGDQEKMYRGEVAVFNKVMRSGLLSRDNLKLLKEKLVFTHSRYRRRALLDGREAAARKALIAGIKLTPWNIKLYIYLVLSLLGTRKFLALKNWRKILGRHSVGSQSSGVAKSIDC